MDNPVDLFVDTRAMVCKDVPWLSVLGSYKKTYGNNIKVFYSFQVQSAVGIIPSMLAVLGVRVSLQRNSNGISTRRP